MRLRKFLFIILCLVISMLLTSCFNFYKNKPASASGNSNRSLKISSPYWVENSSRLVSANGVAFEDSEGIYNPLLSHDGKFVAYSNGGDTLIIYNLSNGKRKDIYKVDDADYRVYAVGWSADDMNISLITSQSGGFIGGNELICVDVNSGKSKIIMSKLSGADLGIDGKYVIADSSDVKIVDDLGRVEKTLKTPEMQAFFSASNPTFSPDGKYVIYSCGETYYLHDIANDEYEEIFETRSTNGPARINSDGIIIVDDKSDLYIYDMKNDTYEVYYDKADSCYPNW